MEASTIALIIIGVLLVLYITEFFPIATTSIIGCLALAIFGVIPFNTAFAGFGNDMVFLMAGMIIVGNALFETGIAKKIGEAIISQVGDNEKLFVIALVVATAIPSAFLSNTAAVAMMLPVAGSAIKASAGKFSTKKSFMFVGIAGVAGGGLTLIGSTPQIIAQRNLLDSGYQGMSFFELAYFGLLILVLLIVYYIVFGKFIEKRIFNFEEVISDVVEEDKIEYSLIKQAIAVIVLVLCIIGFMADIWSLGVVAMVGASLLVVTGCVSQANALKKMDWTTIIVIACSLGISAGLDQSGAGELIARTTVNILPTDVSVWFICAALLLITIVLSNFMSNTATAALLIPISMSMAIQLGIDVKSLVMVIVIGANISYATPISTPPMTMTLSVGYRFLDYLKVGGLFTLFAYILVVLTMPLFLNI